MDGYDHPSTIETPADRALELSRLVALAKPEYERERKPAARRLGMRLPALDEAVRELQRQARAEDAQRALTENTDPEGRAELLVDSADLPKTARELAGALAAMPNMFDRGAPVRLVRDAMRDTHVAQTLSVHGVVNAAHAILRPYNIRADREGNPQCHHITLPERVASLYLDNRDGWGLRPLDGITTAPLLASDGSLRVVEGYDPVTRLWCEKPPGITVPDDPTRADAAAALLELRRWFRTFAFADAVRVTEADNGLAVVDTTLPPGVDESGYLVALLGAVCRPCLRLAPALMLRAPQFSGSGTGKGLLVRMASAIAFGQHPVAITAGGTNEELDKRITAALMEAGTTLFLDNVNATSLKSDVLASAITERPAAVRPLGFSKLVQLNPTAFVAVTGNGLLLSEDLARRFVVVELDAHMEDPEARSFRGDRLAETLAARATLLGALLTIWRWGRQQGDALPHGRPLGSFTDWARWCRDPLLALGCHDPAERIAQAKADDPQRQRIMAIFAAWHAAHGERLVMVKELHSSVLECMGLQGQNRQNNAAMVRGMVGTMAGGMVLTRYPSAGVWGTDKYALAPCAHAPAEA